MKAAQFMALDKPTDRSVFMRKKIHYSVEMIGNAGYGYYEIGITRHNNSRYFRHLKLTSESVIVFIEQ